MEHTANQDAIDPRATPIFLEGKAGGVGVVLIHGLTASPTEVAPIAHFLHDHDPSMTISCPLLPGHGRTPAALRRTSAEDWIAAVDAEIDRLSQRCSTIGVLGVSLGAVLAAHAAITDPRVRSVAMLAPVFELPPMKAVFVRAMRHFVPYAKKSRRSLENHRKKGLFSYDRYPLTSLAHLHAFGSRVRRRLSDLQVPTLIAVGHLDRYIDPSSAPSLCHDLGTDDVTIVDCASSGHILPHEPDAPELMRRIGEWLRRVHTGDAGCPSRQA